MQTAAPLGTVEAAERIGVERSTLSRWVASGRIVPLHKLPGKNGVVLFSPEEVDRVRDEYAETLAASSSASESGDQA